MSATAISQKVREQPEKVRELLNKVEEGLEEVEAGKVVAWNKGWNQFGKPKG